MLARRSYATPLPSRRCGNQRALELLRIGEHIHIGAPMHRGQGAQLDRLEWHDPLAYGLIKLRGYPRRAFGRLGLFLMDLLPLYGLRSNF